MSKSALLSIKYLKAILTFLRLNTCAVPGFRLLSHPPTGFLFAGIFTIAFFEYFHRQYVWIVGEIILKRLLSDKR